MSKRSRRAFLAESVVGLNGAWVATNYPSILAAQEYVRSATRADKLPRLEFFNEAQATEIEAITAQIIPSDDTPGAREAHSVYFIDRALSTFARKSQAVYLQGLRDLEAKAGKFSALSSEQQIKVLTEMEQTPFFKTVRTHTVIGFLARPVHGGNYEEIGWKLIGYNGSLKHQPPFGYYDAEEKAR